VASGSPEVTWEGTRTPGAGVTSGARPLVAGSRKLLERCGVLVGDEPFPLGLCDMQVVRGEQTAMRDSISQGQEVRDEPLVCVVHDG
jgi:hypothetical protein